MTTEERLLNVGWQRLSHFAELTILGRENKRLLYAPKTDSVERIYTVSSSNERLFDLRYPTSIDFLDMFNEVKK
jgi:hypothetical protein